MATNKEKIDAIEDFMEFASLTDRYEFAKVMGKKPEHADGDSWVVEKFHKMRENPLGFFMELDRGHKALILRAMAGEKPGVLDRSDKRWDYEYWEDSIGAMVCLSYTINHDSDYGADADGNRGITTVEVEIDDYVICLADTDITNYFDDDEYTPQENDALLERILEHDRSKAE